MTIRLRCAECRRKLKVPDQALGKKVQCPACGARFIGTIEPPPLVPQPSVPMENGSAAPPAEAAGERAPAPEAPPVEQPSAEMETLPSEREPASKAAPEETPLLDALFAEMAEHRLPDVAVPPESSPPASPPPSPFLSLELEEAPAEAEPAEALDEMVILDDAPAVESLIFSDVAEEPPAAVEEEPIEVVDEVSDEEVKSLVVGRKPKRAEPDEEEEAEEIEELEEADEAPVSRRRQPKKKSRTGLLIGLLIGGLLLLAGCAGIGYFLYRNFFAVTVAPTIPVKPPVPQRPMVPPPPPKPRPAVPVNPARADQAAMIPESEWKWTSPPGGRCSFQMPGTPRRSITPADGAIHYQVERPRQGGHFEVAYHDLDASKPIPGDFLEQSLAEIRKRLVQATKGGTWNEESIKVGVYPGRELVFEGQQGGATLTRLYVVQAGKTHRVYQLTVSGATMYRGQGDARKFFLSFMIASGDR